jgi:hypothetical protein
MRFAAELAAGAAARASRTCVQFWGILLARNARGAVYNVAKRSALRVRADVGKSDSFVGLNEIDNFADNSIR